jgi:ribulose-5-phosphate 4-epimerase/fuculose-1-phosphate aldolase
MRNGRRTSTSFDAWKTVASIMEAAAMSSLRVDDGALITPTGAHSGNLTLERVELLDRRDAVVGSGIPSSEWHMHTAILRAFPVAKPAWR